MVVIGSEHYEEDEGSGEAEPSASSELSVELAREREITQRLEDMTEYERSAAELGMSLPDYMGGAYTDSPGRVVHSAARFKERLESGGVAFIKSRHTGVKSIAEMGYDEQGDAPSFSPEQLLGRYKFYLSLGEGAEAHSEADRRQQQVFVENLITAATNTGIDVSWKIEDHGYDMPDIYTSQPDALRDIIVTMYNSDHYPKTMWNDVPRIFQLGLGGGVSPLHIGVVQEPSAHGIRENVSHSVRMGRLGEAFLGHQAAGLDRRGAFEAACRAVGVRPDKPWLIDEAASEAFLAAARAYHDKSEV